MTLTRGGADVASAPAPRRPAERTPPGGTGLRHEPALDGLRGLAVVVVVLFHLDRLQGGFLGVDLFFVLSGFLITALVVTEHGRTGAVDLRRFWARRARRLLPALALMLVGVSLLLLRFTAESDRARFRGDALATLGYVANWHRMTAEVGYWDIFSVPSPLDHTWSLAIEEQFYVLFPLVALAILGWRTRHRRDPVDPGHPGEVAGAAGEDTRDRRLAVVALIGAAASLALLWVTYRPDDTNRAYFATDTRLGPTLLGVALACLVARRPRREAPPGPLLELAALGALGIMAAGVVAIDGMGPRYYHGGLAVFAVAALVVIRVVTGGPPGPLARVLSVWPLRRLGAISYGIYLWHWPIIVFATPERTSLDGWALDTLRIGLTLAVSAVSYAVVEQPIRRGAWPGRPIRLAAVAATAVTLVAVIASTSGTAGTVAEVTTRVPLDGSDHPDLIYPAPDEVPPDATRVLLVGDSGVWFLGPPFAAAAADHGAVVATSSQILCSPVNAEGRTRRFDGQVSEREPCHEERRELWSEMVEDFDPDFVVYYLANAGGAAVVRLDGQWVLDCDPAYDAYIQDALRRDADLLGSRGAPVMFTTTPYISLPVARSDERVDCRNQTYREVAAERPGTEVVDLNAFVDDRAAEGTGMFVDGLHLSEDGAGLVTDWLFPQVLRLARPHEPPPSS